MDRIEEMLVAILELQPAQRQRLFRLLAERGALPQQVRDSAATPIQLELVSSSPKREKTPDYVLVFDGGSKGNPGIGYGSYAITRVRDGAQRLQRLEFGDGITNNEAEYDSLIVALQDLLRRIEEAGRQPQEFVLEVRGDSALVINQLQGKWRAKDPRMRKRRNRCARLLGHFGEVTVKAHPREESVRILGH